LALVYWVIIFVTTEIFGLKIFKETTTATFYLSILGILVLLVGALIINIMFNLSRIADKLNNDNEIIEKVSTKKGKGIIIFLLSLPVVIAALFFGNYLSSKKAENELKKSADKIIGSYQMSIDELPNYTFDRNWINSARNLLSFMVRIDPNFSNVAIILEDEINGNTFYLTVSDGYEINENDTLRKINYLRNYELKEREYIENVFKENSTQKYFFSNNGVNRLFVPYQNNKIKIIFLFSNRRSFGTLSSG
jgi:NADH:ubiquinone oxidoreductase subunit 5 (subunit L)/multisubunit Na+/H+ antiporter MnhA subunit